MADGDVTIKMDGMEETLNKISFLESFGVNKDYLQPAMKSIRSKIITAERKNIPSFSGATRKDMRGRITENGVGSVTLTVGPSKRKHIFRFVSGGAQWHDRGESVSTWRGRERARTVRGEKAMAAGRKANPSFVPASRLVEWVKKKMGASDSEALHVAFKVAKSIGRKGLQARPIVPPTVQEVAQMIQDTLAAAINKMVEELGKHGKD
jgi:hypothetical protein